MASIVMTVGVALAFCGVGLGAFGAHGLTRRVTADRLKTYQTGVQYQLFHSLAILVTGLAAFRFAPAALLVWAAWLFVAGIVLFSGSLYFLALVRLPARWGVITPLGGLCFLGGWALWLVALATRL
ncbi:MAG: DUF423 domain-containing protein [Sulfobacillus acidophilus]|uniref:DUF423 domain-containing protein n=1 Tax=Sulfobacillus acidophilus TaxID=53633 RepID=A0A2T2WPK1_9FIRM|nr:MAG: DUF423 domain-containing protein [Sulfobacillus acidophilus]